MAPSALNYDPTRRFDFKVEESSTAATATNPGSPWSTNRRAPDRFRRCSRSMAAPGITVIDEQPGDRRRAVGERRGRRLHRLPHGGRVPLPLVTG